MSDGGRRARTDHTTADGHVGTRARAPGAHPSLQTVLWWATGATSAALATWRFHTAVASGVGTDLGFFLDAARQVEQHHSAYDAAYYVYSPLVAWMLSPIATTSYALVVWTILSLTACLAAVGATVWTLRPLLHPWQRPAVALVAVITMLSDPMLSLDLTLGQIDTLILAVTACAALLAFTRRCGWASVVLAIGAILKTWPLLFAVWLIRRGAPHRLRAVLAYAVTIAAFLGVVAAVAGPTEIVLWVGRTVGMSSQQFAVWSAWGVGRELLTPTGNFVPLAHLPIVATAVDVVLGSYVVALIVFILLHPGHPVVALWNIVMASVLLLPVSHQQYQVLFVPLVWIWLAWAMHEGWRGWGTLAFAVVITRWALPIALGVAPVDSRWKYLAIMVFTLATLGVSAVLGAKTKQVLGAPAHRRGPAAARTA